jgi:hypothetical protein
LIDVLRNNAWFAACGEDLRAQLAALGRVLPLPSPTFASSAWFGGDAEAEYGVDIEFRLIL